MYSAKRESLFSRIFHIVLSFTQMPLLSHTVPNFVHFRYFPFLLDQIILNNLHEQPKPHHFNYILLEEGWIYLNIYMRIFLNVSLSLDRVKIKSAVF